MVCVRGKERLTLQVMMPSMRTVKCKGLKPPLDPASDEGAMLDYGFVLETEMVISTEEGGNIDFIRHIGTATTTIVQPQNGHWGPERRYTADREPKPSCVIRLLQVNKHTETTREEGEATLLLKAKCRQSYIPGCS
jgi:hypothetical protein